MNNIQDKNRLRVVLGASPVNMEESFPKGIMFKKIEQAYLYDNVAKKMTDQKDGYQVTATDIATLEDIQVKLPQETNVPEKLLGHIFKPITFTEMTGYKNKDFKVFLRADKVIVLDEK